MKTICLVIMWLTVATMMGAIGGAPEPTGVVFKGASAPTAEAINDSNVGEEEIQWFRDQMRISEKYVEEYEGIWGMSWAHFFTMVFLVLFAVGALVVFVQRQKGTREILEMIRKEIDNGNTG